MIVEEMKIRFITIEDVRFEIREKLTLDDLIKIERIICEEYNISVGLLRSHFKEYPYNDARHITWFVLHHLFGQSKAGIARYYERNHTSILSSLRTMKGYIEKQDEKIMPHFRNVIHKLKEAYL
jgi:chromosomal replication initiation ATPase DnaA